MNTDVYIFLLMKPEPRLVGPTCQSDQRDCKRPVWGDGRLNGSWFGLCSRCLHQHLAFHSPYTTLQANPAAAKLDGTGIQRLTFASYDADAPHYSGPLSAVIDEANEGWPTDWAGYDDALND